MEDIRIDLTSKIALDFLNKIEEEKLRDEEVLFILAKLVRLVTFAIEKDGGKAAGDIAFLQFIKIYDLSEETVRKI